MDWAAHAQEPLPHRQDIVRLDGASEGVRLRHTALVPEPGSDGLARLDGLLTAGLLGGADLVRLAAPAGLPLGCLGSAARRTDAPPEAAEARSVLADLVRSELGTDPGGPAPGGRGAGRTRSRVGSGVDGGSAARRKV
nr:MULTISPECIES: hypothetical protein [Streptomyces]